MLAAGSELGALRYFLTCLGNLENLVWHRVIRWWTKLRRWTGRTSADSSPAPTADGDDRRSTGSNARCRETGTAGSASGLGKRTGSNPSTAPQADSTIVPGVYKTYRPYRLLVARGTRWPPTQTVLSG